jgi:hypothetical protein
LIRHRAFPVAALVCIYALSVVVFALIARQHRFPNLFPDEMFYGKLSQSFASGDGLQWRGSDWGLPPLWPVVLSAAWHFGSIPDGYSAARVLTAVVGSTVVFPVWLLGRVFLGPRLALVPATLSVMGAWMVVTSYLVSENLAYPLATASLACTVMAVRDTRARWLAWSLGFAVLAALSRTQMLCLPVILLVALLLDLARQPAGGRRARIDARPRALWIGLVVAVVGGLLAFVVDPNLTNYDVLGHHASVGNVASTAGRHAASSIVMFAFIPVAAVVALMTRASNWRDDGVGPLLVTIAAGAVVLYPLVGRFEAWATHGQPVDRYAMYLAPLLLVAMLLVPGRVGWRTAVLCAVGVVAVLFALPVTNNYIEQPALYGTQKRLFELGLLKAHVRLAVVVAAVPITVFGTLVIARAKAAVGAAAAAVLIGAVMVAQLWTSQHAEVRLEKSAAPIVLPHPRDWVDRAADGPVAMLAIAQSEPLRGNSDLYTDFFNRKVKYLFSTEPAGSGECQLDVGARGVLKQVAGPCPAWPREYVLLERVARATFYGQNRIASQRDAVLVRLPPHAPRLFALVQPPCSADGCTGKVRLAFHLDAPARVAVHFSGEPKVIRLKVAGGDRRIDIPVDSNGSDGPQLQSVYVTSAGKTTRVF